MAKKQFRSIFGKTVITPTGRLVFPAVARPAGFEGQNPKYSAMLVVHSGDKLNILMQSIAEVGHKSFGEKFQTDSCYKPIKDGQEIMQMSDKAPAALYQGNYRIIAKGAVDKEPPKCYLADKSLMPRVYGNEEDLNRIEQQFYAGCYCRFAVTPFSFNTGANKGVGLILKGIQFIKDGERLGAPNLEEAFEEGVEEGYEFDETSAAFEDEEVASVDETNL